MAGTIVLGSGVFRRLNASPVVNQKRVHAKKTPRITIRFSGRLLKRALDEGL